MKIAVTYDKGMIFQHFGKTEEFKYYETDEQGNITDFAIKSNNGQGHSALADILKSNGVDVLICGGIGEGAQDALAMNGIEIYAGNTGNADAAVIAFLAGKMEKKAVKCDHHEHEHGEGHSCSEHSCK
jgi:predicted Fe-Mo cluster-binding NifX family protein